MAGRSSSSSDSRNACRLMGTRASVGDVTAVEADVFVVVRSSGELDVDGEFGSDSGRLGSWSRLEVEGLGCKACDCCCKVLSVVKAVRLLEAEESRCLLLLLEMTLLLSESLFLGLIRAGRPCLS